MKVCFEFEDGRASEETEAYEQLNLLAHAQILEVSLQSRCGGHCECGTCRIRLVSGRLSAMQPEEKALLEKLGLLDSGFRLACQCFPEVKESNKITIDVPKEKFKDARFIRK